MASCIVGAAVGSNCGTLLVRAVVACSQSISSGRHDADKVAVSLHCSFYTSSATAITSLQLSSVGNLPATAPRNHERPRCCCAR
jgi:hypothetical protein